MLSFLLWPCSNYKCLRITLNFDLAKFEISVHHTASPWDIFKKPWNKLQHSLLFECELFNVQKLSLQTIENLL